MNNLSILSKPEITMTSREIAELTGKNHSHVMRDIRTLVSALEQNPDLDSVHKITKYEGINGQEYEQYELDKDTTLTLLLGYDAVARMKVVKRWQELENQLAPQLPQTYAEALRQLADKHEQLQLTEQQRDNAIRTKAEIGSRREATSMATASAAVRKANKLQIELDRSLQYASIKRVEILTGGRYDWRKLKDASNSLELEIEKVFDQNYGEINAYHADAWLSAYGLDINNL